jgi:hypothetical protein
LEMSSMESPCRNFRFERAQTLLVCESCEAYQTAAGSPAAARLIRTIFPGIVVGRWLRA